MFQCHVKPIIMLVLLLLHPSPHFTINLQDFSYKCVFAARAQNSVDPDKLVSQKPAYLDLFCFERFSIVRELI